MSHELLKQVAEITNKKTTKLSATEVLELQICASVLDFIDDVGSVEELRAKVNSF
jgi:ribosomal protein L28